MGLLARIPVYTSKLWPHAKPDLTRKEETIRRLGLAMAQRSLMAVAFQNPDLAGMDFSGPCFHINENTLFVDSPCNDLYSTCYGEDAKVFFSLEDDDSTIFFQFTSKVRGYEPGCGFALAIPAELHPSQRRECFRIAPPLGAFLNMNVWPIEGEDLPQSFPSPVITEIIQDSGAGAGLVNISASGLRIHASLGPDAPISASGPDSRLLVFLQLKDDSARRPQPPAYAQTPEGLILQINTNVLNLWLACTVKYRMEEIELSKVIFGLNFIAWAALGVGENRPVWLKTGFGGQIPLLANWVWQQHLALAAWNRQHRF